MGSVHVFTSWVCGREVVARKWVVVAFWEETLSEGS